MSGRHIQHGDGRHGGAELLAGVIILVMFAGLGWLLFEELVRTLGAML